MKDDEYKLLTDPEYTKERVEKELARGTFYFYEQLEVEDSYICDCHKNYGKKCLYPEEYREGGCN